METLRTKAVKALRDKRVAAVSFFALTLCFAYAGYSPLRIEAQEPIQGSPILSNDKPTYIDRENQFQVYSKPFLIDRLYLSMDGPYSGEMTTMKPKSQPPEILWLTGIRTEIVDQNGKEGLPPQFMCHLNFNYHPKQQEKIFGTQASSYQSDFSSLFLLSQGAVFVDFPEGFGIPLLSNQDLFIGSQVLNANYENPNIHVRQKITVDYTRDKNLKTPLKPLFMRAAAAKKYVSAEECLEVTPPAGTQQSFEAEQTSCHVAGEEPQNPAMATQLVGELPPNSKPDGTWMEDGKKVTIHWVVKPGVEVNRSNVTWQLDIPYDTTMHYAVIHVHPFAESVELWDATAKKTVFKSKVINHTDKIGLVFAEPFSSVEGVPVYKDHQYEIISVYNNTSGVDRDSMADIFCYLFDKKFKKPQLETVYSTKKLAPIKRISKNR